MFNFQTEWNFSHPDSICFAVCVIHFSHFWLLRFDYMYGMYEHYARLVSFIHFVFFFVLFYILVFFLYFRVNFRFDPLPPGRLSLCPLTGLCSLLKKAKVWNVFEILIAKWAGTTRTTYTAKSQCRERNNGWYLILIDIWIGIHR